MIITTEVQGICGPQTLSDGGSGRLRQGRQGELIFSPAKDRYSECSERSELFIGSTPAAGVTVPIFSNTTQQFVLYNPLGSGKKLNLLQAWAGYVSGTHVAGHLCYATNTLLTNTVTGTAALIQNGYLLNAAASPGCSAQLFTAATVTAFTYLRPFGVSTVVQAATATNAPWMMVDSIDGSITVPPGGAVAIAANVAAIMVATLGITWRESPV